MDFKTYNQKKIFLRLQRIMDVLADFSDMFLLLPKAYPNDLRLKSLHYTSFSERLSASIKASSLHDESIWTTVVAELREAAMLVQREQRFIPILPHIHRLVEDIEDSPKKTSYRHNH